MKLNRIKVLLFIFIFVSPALAKTKPSSEIPARREFPINKTISPCKDFYAYACSEVNSSFKLREDRSSHDFAFNDSYERILEAKKKYLLNLGQNTQKLSPHAQALKDVYLGCMNVEASKKEEKELVSLFLEKMNSLKTSSDFKHFIASKVATEDFSFISFGTATNQDNADWDDAYFLGKLQFLPERSYYDNPKVTKDYESLLAYFFKTLKLDHPKDRATSVLKFEKEFSKTYPLPKEFRDLFSSRTEISKKELIEKYPNLEFSSFLAKLPDKTHIRHLTPDNFDFLNKALDQTSLDTLKNIYLFRALVGYMDDAYPQFYAKRFEFRKKHLGGPNQRPVRQERCTMKVMNDFEKELDEQLLPQLFPNFPEDKVFALAETIRNSIMNGLDNNQWLSADGKKAAIKKIKVAKLQMIKPKTNEEWDFNPPAQYSPEKPYSNLRLLEKNIHEKEIQELNEPRHKERWGMGPLTVNAYYSRSDNKFVMPMGILQYPFYDPTLSLEVNLGAVGAVMAHELGHGIDDKGALYDYKGQLSQWLSDSDIIEFKNRGKNLVSQFNKIGHNGELTQGENTADLVGLSFAYQAAFPNDQGTQALKQSFFLQFARLWCTVQRPKFRELLLKTDPHAMGEARVNQQVKQQPGFQEAFQCKPSDPMVLSNEDRVKIW